MPYGPWRRRHPQGRRDVEPLLNTPVRALKEGNLTQGSKVGQTLVDLRRTVEDLDPGKDSAGKKFLGIFPFGKKMEDYFRKYQSSQQHLNAILHALRSDRTS